MGVLCLNSGPSFPVLDERDIVEVGGECWDYPVHSLEEVPDPSRGFLRSHRSLTGTGFRWSVRDPHLY